MLITDAGRRMWVCVCAGAMTRPQQMGVFMCLCFVCVDGWFVCVCVFVCLCLCVCVCVCVCFVCALCVCSACVCVCALCVFLVVVCVREGV